MRHNQLAVRLRIGIMLFVIIAVTALLPAINIQAATKSSKSNKYSSSKDLEINLNDKTYTVLENIKKTDIPKDFSLDKEVEYDGKQYKGLKFKQGDVSLLYLASKENKTDGTYYMVDEQSNNLYPFIKVQGNQNYIILLNGPSNAKVPEGYQKTKLTTDGTCAIDVYHYDKTNTSQDVQSDSDSQDLTPSTEISNKTSSLSNTLKSLFGSTTVYADTKSTAKDLSTDATLNTDVSDFYLVYAIDSKGVVGWYQYDKKESTYQRFVDMTSGQVAQEEKYQTLENKYDTLQKANEANKSFIRKAELVLGFVALIMVLLLINCMIRIAHLKADIRDLEEDEMDDEYDDDEYENQNEEYEVLEPQKEPKEKKNYIHEEKSTKMDMKQSKKEKEALPSEDSILKAMQDEEMELLN